MHTIMSILIKEEEIITFCDASKYFKDRNFAKNFKI